MLHCPVVARNCRHTNFLEPRQAVGADSRLERQPATDLGEGAPVRRRECPPQVAGARDECVAGDKIDPLCGEGRLEVCDGYFVVGRQRLDSVKSREVDEHALGHQPIGDGNDVICTSPHWSPRRRTCRFTSSLDGTRATARHSASRRGSTSRARRRSSRRPRLLRGDPRPGRAGLRAHRPRSGDGSRR